MGYFSVNVFFNIVQSGVAVSGGQGRGMMNFSGNPWAAGATRATADKKPPGIYVLSSDVKQSLC